MRRNDFFKYLLFGGGANAASRTKLETETLPYTFYTQPQTLKNYRIYGNTVDGESVGDRTANLFANLWKKGYLRADNGREEQIDGFICSGFFPVEYGQTYSISRNINVGYDNVRGYRDDGSFIGAGTDVCDVSNPIPSAATNIGVFTVTNENVAFIRFNDSANDLGMKYMIVDGTYTEQTMPAYEPYGYRVPVTVTNGTDTETTNIYLPEQIRKVGDEAEYIDFREQKQHFADGTSADVTLPAIPILFNTNTLSVGTTVQPSKVYLQGKISEAEIVSARSLQTNMQSLQPLSFDDEDLEIDVMPTDNDLQLDVKPIEKPVLNLNNVSEIENAEIERGVENAE